jgi:aspartate aminotransferase-like enzyme
MTEHRLLMISAIRNPQGVDAELVGAMREERVVIAGGLHPDLEATYFRIGRMGSTGPAELRTAVGALERALHRCGHRVEPGVGLAAAARALA